MIYVVFDRRANINLYEAKILEYIGERTPEEVYKEFLASWGDSDAVLVEYDVEDGVPAHPVVVPREAIKIKTAPSK